MKCLADANACSEVMASRSSAKARCRCSTMVATLAAISCASLPQMRVRLARRCAVTSTGAEIEAPASCVVVAGGRGTLGTLDQRCPSRALPATSCSSHSFASSRPSASAPERRVAAILPHAATAVSICRSGAASTLRSQAASAASSQGKPTAKPTRLFARWLHHARDT